MGSVHVSFTNIIDELCITCHGWTYLKASVNLPESVTAVVYVNVFLPEQKRSVIPVDNGRRSLVRCQIPRFNYFNFFSTSVVRVDIDLGTVKIDIPHTFPVRDHDQG